MTIHRFKLFRKRLAHIFVLLSFLCVSHTAFAYFHKNIWPKWVVYNPFSHAVISHQEWQDFLNCCVKKNHEGIQLVDYPHLSTKEKDGLKQYIARLSSIDISRYNRNEQLAYWLNLYNALVIKTVADYYPIDSVQDIKISPGLFNTGPWGAPIVTIAGTSLTLDDIQNRIIRPIWNDPRTHYALNDATLGDANLLPYAFQGNLLEQQLNQVACDYINSLRGVQVIEGKLIVSKIYAWYLDDFGGTESALIYHLSQFSKKQLREQLQHISTVNSYIYNWHLNTTIE
jgi:hypothetical protein